MEKFYCITVGDFKFDCFKISNYLYYCPSQQKDFFRHGNGEYSNLDHVRPELDKKMKNLMDVPFWEMGRCQVE